MARTADSINPLCQETAGDFHSAEQGGFSTGNQPRPEEAHPDAEEMQSLQQWASVAGHDLHPGLQEPFLAIVNALNASGYADGTLTEIARKGGLRRTDGITHKVRSLEIRGLVARRGTRMWAAHLAPPLSSKTEKEAKIVGEQRQRILWRDGHECRACGGTKRLCIDHIVAWSCGGSNDDDNLQVLCGSCNSRKRDRTQEEFEALCVKAGIVIRQRAA